MKRFWRALVELTSAREPGYPWALFRISVGLVIISSLISISAYGLVDLFWIDKKHGGALTVGSNWLLSLVGGPTRGAVTGMIIAGLSGAILLTIGVGGRFVTLVTLQAYQALFAINFEASGGYDQMILNALFLLLLVDGSRTLSLGAWLATRRTGRATWAPRVQVLAFARYLAIFQLLVIYTMTGIQKLSPVWTPLGGYSALYWVFQDPTWRRFDMRFTASVYPITQIATAVTWHFEIGSAFMSLVYWFRWTRDRPKGRLRRLFNRFDLRVPFVVTGALLHLGILFLINVGPFSYISLAFYFCFLTEADTAWMVARFRRVTRRTSADPAQAP